MEIEGLGSGWSTAASWRSGAIQRTAEKELAHRRQRVGKFEIRPLDPAARERYLEQWAAAQRYFVDEPVGAVGQAHELVQRVMSDRGYPVEEDFARRTADISVEHPAVVENYRAAHEYLRSQLATGRQSTEELRQAMVHFRVLFDELLAPSGTGQAKWGRGAERARKKTLGWERFHSTRRRGDQPMERNEETLSKRDKPRRTSRRVASRPRRATYGTEWSLTTDSTGRTTSLTENRSHGSPSTRTTQLVSDQRTAASAWEQTRLPVAEHTRRHLPRRLGPPPGIRPSRRAGPSATKERRSQL